jgi:predicted TIM-barrel fold metal-dependent hydrolase
MSSRYRVSSCVALAAVLALVVVLRVAPAASTQAPTAGAASADRLTVDQVMAMPKVDAHAHVRVPLASGERAAFVRFLEQQNLRWLNICVGGMNAERLERQIAQAHELHAAYPERLPWATSFALGDWGKASWAEGVNAQIDAGFERGAVAAKVWKDVGMELKDASGRYVMIDDPGMTPVLAAMAARGRPLVAHLGEPRNCWLPLDKMTTASDRNYFGRNPQYHGFLHPEVPNYEKQIAARDAILETHPTLKMIGCHLGSLEYDVDELARRLDKYPNLAVDLAARLVHLQIQPRDKVRAFLIRYQDRILYATDFDFGGGKDEAAATELELKTLAESYRRDATWLATEETVPVPRAAEGFTSRGVSLPDPVLRKIYFENAKRWYPGL